MFFTSTRALLLFATAISISSSTKTPEGCRTIPGDLSWPSSSEWDQFNQSVGGNLVATLPIAAPCHNTLFGQPSSLYDPDACEALRNVWYYPTTHLVSSSSPMAYPFSNNSCNPFLDSDTPCTIGSHVVYAVDATSSEDFQATVRFAKDNNIRLVIRNTGHDYLGKSTGAHALGLWTHNLKSMELIQDYQTSNYNGPAIRLGAGVEVIEAYEFADSQGYVVVGGNCPTVGLAGGYIQGGGHGPLSSKFGLATDQVLEYEVVTADGELLTATETKNTDLFWALRGGGGGTFGVVVSVVVKALPDSSFSTAYLTLLNNGTNEDALYSSLVTFIETLPNLTDAGAIAIFLVNSLGFFLTPAIFPDITSEELDAHLGAFIDSLDSLGLTYTYKISSYPTFLTTFNSVSATIMFNVSDQNLGGRLLPRSFVENNGTADLVEAMRYISTQSGNAFIGNAFNVKGGVSSSDDVAANPAFREALFNAAIEAPIRYLDWPATLDNMNSITNDLLPRLEALTPGGGAYLNEGDVHQPNFQSTFYGDHYSRLLRIKQKYDPNGIFYAATAVGSEGWAEDNNGRLCRTCFD